MQIPDNLFTRIFKRVILRNGQKPKNHNDEYKDWYRSVVNIRGSSVKEVFYNFKFIVRVDWNKFFNHGEPFSWTPNDEAKKFLWPEKKMGECAIWNYFRVIEENGDWVINELGGYDYVFVATNSEEEATMIALMFS